MKVRDLVLTCESLLTVHVSGRIFDNVLKIPTDIMMKEVDSWSFSHGALYIYTEEE